MAVDMRGFAASAHAALDEKERIKGRVRRMRHEWKLERSTQETEQLTLERAQGDLEKLIEFAQEQEESAVQDDTRRECRLMRDAFARAEFRERRVGYLKAQSGALMSEFKRLGEVADVNNNKQGGDRFNPEDPSTCGTLTGKLRQNDVRNESAHSYVQSLDLEVKLQRLTHSCPACPAPTAAPSSPH